MTTFQPLRAAARALDRQIVEHITNLVAAGELRPGDRLPPERALAAQLGVSRTALREALHTLAAHGLVEQRHGTGIFIRAGNGLAAVERLARAFGERAAAQWIADLFAVRVVLEGAAAEWAATNATAEQVAALRALLDSGAATYARTPVDTDQAGALDAQFHALVAAGTGNGVLLRLMATMMDELAALRRHSLAIPGRAALSFAQHQQIVAAIAARDPAAARAAMVAHLTDVERAINAGPGTPPDHPAPE